MQVEPAESALAIMAAGRSTRYGKLKQLAPVGPAGETLLDFTIFDAVRTGFTEIVLIVRSEILDSVQETVGRRWQDKINLKFALQDSPPAELATPYRSKPWGTAHAVLTASFTTDRDLAVVNADDYYGEKTLLSLRRAIQQGDSQISIVTHQLDRTLSENGAVSRGICDVDSHGYLTDIRETHNIHRSDSIIVGEYSDNLVRLAGSEPVCMNTWHFTRTALELMNAEWALFLANEAENESVEFGLAPIVNRLLANGKVRVNVEGTPDECFGLTNPGDEQRVQEKLQLLHLQGSYPSPLLVA